MGRDRRLGGGFITGEQLKQLKAVLLLLLALSASVGDAAKHIQSLVDDLKPHQRVDEKADTEALFPPAG